MTATLSGKWVWVWNWRRCEGGDPDPSTRSTSSGQASLRAGRVAARLRAAGCTGALVKAFDGPRWFDQGSPWRDIARELKAQGLPAVGGWGYLYGRDPAGEAQRAVETAQYGGADLLVLDVESEFKDRPEAAEEVCRRIRASLGPDYPLYFSSFAIARYHRSFPYEAFRRYCSGAAPQVYWNAFRWPVERALAWTYEDYAALGMPPEDIFPVAGVYREGFVPYPSVESVQAFARQASASGSGGVSFWSFEHMDGPMWQAVAGAQLEEEEEMSSQEFQQVSRSLSALAARVDGLEAEVRSLKPPSPAPAARTYTVKRGDTLSGIAAKLGLSGWQRLYEANRDVIGPDPNVIRPGQVLAVP